MQGYITEEQVDATLKLASVIAAQREADMVKEAGKLKELAKGVTELGSKARAFRDEVGAYPALLAQKKYQKNPEKVKGLMARLVLGKKGQRLAQEHSKLQGIENSLRGKGRPMSEALYSSDLGFRADSFVRALTPKTRLRSTLQGDVIPEIEVAYANATKDIRNRVNQLDSGVDRARKLRNRKDKELYTHLKRRLGNYTLAKNSLILGGSIPAGYYSGTAIGKHLQGMQED